MDKVMEVLTQFIEPELFFIIVIMGFFTIKFTDPITFISKTYKVLISSTIVSIIWYFIVKCDTSCLPKYFMTYAFATTFYELIGKYLKAHLKTASEKFFNIDE